jgi:hypothetical protein
MSSKQITADMCSCIGFVLSWIFISHFLTGLRSVDSCRRDVNLLSLFSWLGVRALLF